MTRGIRTSQLMPGILAGSAEGWALMSDGYLTSGRVVGPGAGRVFQTGAKPVCNGSAPQQNRLFLAAQPAAGDWISIEGTDTVVVAYEFRPNTPPTGGTVGRIWIYDGGSAAAARVNLSDAIHGVVDTNRIAYGAVDMIAGFVARDAPAQTSLMIMEISGSETSRNVTENLTAPLDVWDQATTDGGMLETRQYLVMQTLTVNANHIAAGNVIFSMGIQAKAAWIINHNRPQDEAWAIVAATNAVVLTCSGAGTPNNQIADVVTCIAVE